MEFLSEYGLFLAKSITVVLVTIILLNLIVAASKSTRRQSQKGSISVTNLNKELDSQKRELQRELLDKSLFKKLLKQEKKRDKDKEKKRQEAGDKASEDRRRRVYVINFDGDMAASGVESLREEITTVLTMADKSDEVVVRLESPGGMVHGYGLAASQLLRIRQKQIPLVICVDKVAASGGYMMACVGEKILAAPFAVLGSIGVLMQMPNIYRLLKKNDVDFEMITAGEYKRTLTPFTEITEKGRDKVQQDIEEMHELFKDWVKRHRPVVDIEKVATGETWVGVQAYERQLVDQVMTSDDYIVQACETSDVYEVVYEIKQPLGEKLGGVLQRVLDKSIMTWWQRLSDRHIS